MLPKEKIRSINSFLLNNHEKKETAELYNDWIQQTSFQQMDAEEVILLFHYLDTMKDCKMELLEKLHSL